MLSDTDDDEPMPPAQSDPDGGVSGPVSGDEAMVPAIDNEAEAVDQPTGHEEDEEGDPMAVEPRLDDS